MFLLLPLVAAVDAIPTREQLHNACYGGGGATQECVSMLAQAIVGHAKKCYDKHKEREAYTGCASTFCFSECGENEGCSELCDEKASQAFEFFSSKKGAFLQQDGNFFSHSEPSPPDASRAELQAACYGPNGATADCTALLAKAIITHSKKCFEKHTEREPYTACASNFCFSECGESEGCSELCDEKAQQAFDFFSSQKRESSFLETPKLVRRVSKDDTLDYVSLAQKSEAHFVRREGLRGRNSPGKIDRHKCRVLCQRFMFKMLGKEFEHISHPNDCMPKCDEVYPEKVA